MFFFLLFKKVVTYIFSFGAEIQVRSFLEFLQKSTFGLHFAHAATGAHQKCYKAYNENRGEYNFVKHLDLLLFFSFFLVANLQVSSDITQSGCRIKLERKEQWFI